MKFRIWLIMMVGFCPVSACSLVLGPLEEVEETGEADCGDGLDNDGDGYVDCLDLDCAGGVCGEIYCGDGRISQGEECDGTDFGGKFCPDVVPSRPVGSLSCKASCIFDTSNCYSQ